MQGRTTTVLGEANSCHRKKEKKLMEFRLASLAKALTTSCCSFSTYIPMGAQREDPQQRRTFFFVLVHICRPPLSKYLVKIIYVLLLTKICNSVPSNHLLFYSRKVSRKTRWTAAARTTFFPDEDEDLGHKLNCQILSFVTVKHGIHRKCKEIIFLY